MPARTRCCRTCSRYRLGMRWRSVISPLRTGCSPTWKATSSTASMANMVFLLSRGIPVLPLSGGLCRPGSHSRRSETPGAARRPVELTHFTPYRPCMPGDNQLCNSHAARDPERLLAEIDQDHADFTTIIGIDGARCVGHRHAMLGRQPRAWPDLG